MKSLKGISYMKKNLLTLFVLSALLLIPNAGKATVLLNEHFNQATETLATNDNNGTIGADWTNITGSGNIYMNDADLTYSGYKSSSNDTKSIEYKATYGKKVAKSFTSKNSGSLYAAAIVKINSCGATSGNARDYLWSFCNVTSSNVGTAGYHYGRLCIQKTDSKFKFGISKQSELSPYLAYTEELEYNTPYLVVLEYKFVSGDNNDIVYLYVNPTKGDKPEATLECHQVALNPNNNNADVGSGTKADPSSLVSFVLSNTSSSNKWNCLIDELKVVTDWADLWEPDDTPTPTPSVAAPEPEESDVTTSSATISWDAVEDADSYVLQWKVNGGSYSDDIDIDKDVHSYSMSDLYSNMKYYVRVKTIIGEDESGWAEINFTTESYPATLDYKDITFNNWSTIDALPTSGTYYLANNVYRESSTTLTGNLNLCLNGKTATLLSNIIIPSGYTLTIYDNEGSGSISGYYESAPLSPAGLITIESGGALVIGEGAIQNLDVDPEDGYSAYAIYNQGTLHMSGNPVITAATADIYLFTSKYITLDGELTNTSKYKVNAAGQVITSGWSTHMSGEKPSDYFTSAKSGYRGICVVSNEVKFVKLLALDEEEDNADISDGTYAGTICVSMTRSLTSSQYNTFCLPFALTDAQLQEYFGAGYDLEEFVSSSLEGDVLSLEFSKVTSLEAGKPYLLKPSLDVVNPSFEGVTITATSPADQTSDEYISFHATYSPTELEGGNRNILFLGSGNELFWPASDGQIKAFRAYFEVKGDAPKAAKRARIVKKEDAATGIQNTEHGTQTQKVLRNGKILILRDGKTYNVLGMECK